MIIPDSTDKEIIQKIPDNVQNMSLEETITFCFNVGKMKGRNEEGRRMKKIVDETFANMNEVLENFVKPENN